MQLTKHVLKICWVPGTVLHFGDTTKNKVWSLLLVFHSDFIARSGMQLYKVYLKGQQRNIKQRARGFKRYLYKENISGEEQFLHNHHHSLGPPGGKLISKASF